MWNLHKSIILFTSTIVYVSVCSAKTARSLLEPSYPILARNSRVKEGVECDAGYQCDFFVIDKKDEKVWTWNLNGLCAAVDYDADISDDSSGEILFNICGQANSYCLPASQNSVPYTRGVAIQYFGPTPSPSLCPVPGQSPEYSRPCTRNCEVLGTGQPVLQLLDPNNPSTGGLQLVHQSEAASDRDENECYDAKEGGFIGRSVEYRMHCDPNQEALVDKVSFTESPICHYIISMTSPLACGSSFVPRKDSSTKESSGAGLGAGMFFLGIFVFAILAGGIWYWREKRGGGSFSFGGPSKGTSSSAGTFSSGTGGIGSSL